MGKYDGATGGEWSSPIWHATAEQLAEQRAFGLDPAPALAGDGSRFVMTEVDGERLRVALVDCQTPYKRGQGHRTDCATRDANAQLIAAAPMLLRQRDEAVALLREFVEIGGIAAQFVGYRNDEIWRRADPDGFALIERARALIAEVEA